jgi:hypothetical protein
MSKKTKTVPVKSQGFALACVAVARKAGCYTRSKSWGNDKTRYNRKEGKRVAE